MGSEDDYDFGPALTNLKSRLSREESSTTFHFMRKVPQQFRDVNNKFYEPESVSIGPHHHGKPGCRDTEKLKITVLSASDYVSKLESRWKEVAEVVKEARNCYAEDVIRDKDKFAEILVLDACFVIYFIEVYNIDYDPLFTRNSLLKTMVRDMLLLENQIPYFFLHKLWVIITGANNNFLMERVLKFFSRILFGGNLNSVRKDMEPDEISHILGLIHTCYWRPPESQVQSAPSTPTTQEPKDDTITQQPKDVTITLPPVIPPVSELKQANVKFKSIKVNALVKFEEDCGKLLLPRLVIDSGTESLLRNFIAHEQMHLIEDSKPVTDYALLLNSLINNATDVKILCKCGIIQNMLGSDEAVANFVNQLTYQIIYHDKVFTYSHVFSSINTYYEKRKGIVRWNKAKSEFREKYFSSPWSFIAVVAATVLLLLTVAQTVFAALEHSQRP